MAAICLSTVEAGDHVAAFDCIYGGARLLFEELLDDSMASASSTSTLRTDDAVDEAVTDVTTLVGMESPTLHYR